jgi:CheY-like chemotaxis protein
MSAKEDGNLSGLSLVSDIQSKKKPSECLNHRSFLLSSNKIDSRVDNIRNQKPSAMRNSLDTIGNTASNSQCRIMIVDDEQEIARLFGISLERSGFIIDVFTDPAAALSNYKTGLYDLLLLDIRMPGMNGFKLYQKIKDMDNKVKVCFITAYDEALNDFKKSFPNLKEVDCFVRKPIEMDKLVKLVKSQLKIN